MATLEELITNAVIATLQKKEEEDVVNMCISAARIVTLFLARAMSFIGRRSLWAANLPPRSALLL